MLTKRSRETERDALGTAKRFGLAEIWVKADGHITRGTVKVTRTTTGPRDDTPAWRASTMCQEIGHIWGLGHQDESGADFHTCMDYATNPDADNMHRNRHDYEELAIIYSHVDATTTTIGRAAGASITRTVRTVPKHETDGAVLRGRLQADHLHPLGSLGTST